LEQAQQLSPREMTLLKYIASRGRKQDRTVSFSMKNLCKDLELDDPEFLDTLISLSVKGLIKIVRLPYLKDAQIALRKRFLQADLLSTVFGKGQPDEEKKQIMRILAAMDAPDLKHAEMTSLQELISYSFDLDQMIEQMNENLQSQGTQEQELHSASSEERLLRVQRKLDRCLQEFWKTVNLVMEESQGFESSTPRIVQLDSSPSTVTKKETSLKRLGQEKKARMIALLLAIRADVVTKSAAPSELIEELEELEARALIGEMTPELLESKKKEFEQRVERSRFAVVSISSVGQLQDRLRKRIEVVNALASTGLISKKSHARIIESATSDLEQVEKVFPRQLTDFYVSPSGEFLDRPPDAHHIGSG